MTTNPHPDDEFTTGQRIAGHIALVLLGPLNLAGGIADAGGNIYWQNLAYALVGSLIWWGAAIGAWRLVT